MKRILSVLLVAVTLFGAVAGLIPAASFRVYAEELEEEAFEYEKATDYAAEKTYDSLTQKILGDDGDFRTKGDADTTQDPYMELALTVDAENGERYQLFCNQYTGEVVYYNATTGEAVSTNPHNIGEVAKVSDPVKAQLLSQVVVAFKGNDGVPQTMYSYTEAAQRGQIQVKLIKNGIRVQYAIGRENPTYLIPGWITDARFQEEILGPIEAYRESREEQDAITTAFDFVYQSFTNGSIWTKQDPNDPNMTDTLRQRMFKEFPITAEIDPTTGKNYVIWTLAAKLTDAQKTRFESYVKTYCPDYTYEDLTLDHAKTGYVADEKTPPFFKLCLEYTLDTKDGALDVRLPSNGIIYDETMFELNYISTLNYLGAGSMDTVTYGDYQVSGNAVYGGNSADEILYDGYVFYPDGSGALFEYSDLYTETMKDSVTWSGKVYGQDYAYYTITGQSQEPIRLPVYGVVKTDSVIQTPMYETDANGNPVLDEDGQPIPLKSADGRRNLCDLTPVKSGFLAILTEGEAMTDLTVNFGATRHNYASAYPTYYPRPKDTYDLSDSLSVSGNTEWTVVADRKYTGSYTTRIVLLSGDDADWVGMATTYREYLDSKEILEPIATAGSQIPLYLETFGAIETQKQILSFPVTVKVPLTSFEDVQTIYNDLSSEKNDYPISNIVFKLTGFANGGLMANYPAKLKWERAVGGKSGFRELAAAAKEIDGLSIYPEFDFVYLSNQSAGDGVSLKKLGAKTVDNRYCSKQIYDAVYQQFTSYFDMCVATNMIGKYYDKFSAKLSKYQGDDAEFGLSVSTLGTDLNSNFDEDNMINREEAKEDIVNLLTAMKEDYSSLMIEGGNSYAIGYADHILDMPLASSNYRYASASVPFMAMVLHGYVNYAGAAINMSGDAQYNLLKSVESGAYPYFMLSYNVENTMLLKQDEALNKYYSIRYDIWRWENPDAEKPVDGEIIRQYKAINEALSDLQTALMVDHQFIQSERVLLEHELTRNKKILTEAILAGVSLEIDGVASQLKTELKGSNKLFEAAERYDAELCNVIEQLETGRYTLEDAYDAFRDVLKYEIADPTLIERAFECYRTGDGLEDLHVLLGLDVLVSVDFASLWAEILPVASKLMCKKDGTPNEEELAALKHEVALRILASDVTVSADFAEYFDGLYAELVASADEYESREEEYEELRAERLGWKNRAHEMLYVENGDGYQLADLRTEIKEILKADPTVEQMALINRLIYADYSEAKIALMLDGFAEKPLTATVKEALSEFILTCRAKKYLSVFVETLEVDYDFNETSSEALDGTMYEETDYTLDDERLVLVTYLKADGTEVRIIVNYNLFGVKVRIDGVVYEVDSYDFLRLPTTTGGGR